MILTWPMYTEPRALREVVTRLTGLDQEERTKQKTSHILEAGLTNKNPGLRKVEDLQLSAKRETNRTKSLVSL